MKILISDKLEKEGVQILQAVKEFQVDCKPDLPPEQLKEIIKDYDALIIRSGTQVTADIIAAADRLKFIGRAGVGLDNVDLQAATKKGIVAMNTPAGNTTSTAEQTMSLILSLSRNTPQAYMSMRSGKWDRSKFKGVELYGKTLGVIGLGRIGSTVAAMAKGFGMRAVGFDPYLSMDVAKQRGIEILELTELLRQSDYITVHVPKTAETTSLIGEKEFALMKPTARVINCARGGVINEMDLAKALKEKRIAGAALDVYEQEPPDPKHPLFECDNCVTTPHLGASTSEAQINVAIEIAETVRNALLGKGIVNAANFPSVSAEAFAELGPYIDLGKRMGLFAGQLINGRVSGIKISYKGEFTKFKTEPVTMSLAFGLLSPILGETINAVNALAVAKERGISVETVESQKEEEFVNLVRLDITMDQGVFSVWGTLASNKKPRIVKVNEVYVEAVPDGHILFINNNDKPGVVGAVGTILAEANVNIAGITFGREVPGGKAVSVVNIDSEVPEKVIEKIRKAKDVLFVKLLKVQV
ncbi:MAG TPA: phosphoglycerate dehydrogenase [Candidatus Bathyarchaeia archaeon]|nr:phosphoglycerate dehydrogenase [Candidatus Bathyarchaeia archaeon]